MTNEERLFPFFLELNKKILLEEFIIDKTGVKTVELIAPRIELDPRQSILDFGVRKTNLDYVQAEIEWYDSMDSNVKNTIGKKANIWNKIADRFGNVNSNYGYLIYSMENHYQYKNCLEELKKNKDSRRAVMIYNRPEMWIEYNANGMSDFVCTFAVQYMIRDNKLHAIVFMRSNDIIYGFFNDFYFQCIIYERLYEDIKKTHKELNWGPLVWLAGSWHVYEKHFNLINDIVKEIKK